MKKKIINILIIGKGNIAFTHEKNLKKIFVNSKIYFLIKKNNKKSSTLKSNQYIDDFSLVKKINPDIAIIASPSNTHLKFAYKLIEIGCEIFIEKPISNNLIGVNKFYNLAKNYNKNIQIGYNLRFLDSVIKFKKILSMKKIGKIFSFECNSSSHLPSWRPKKDYSKTVSANNSMGGGVLLELSHEIDLLLYFFGNPKYLTGKISKQSNLKINVEDTANLIMGFDNFTNRKNFFYGSLNLDFINKPDRREIKILTDKLILKLDILKNSIFIYDKSKNKWSIEFKSNKTIKNTYFDQWLFFSKKLKLKSRDLSSLKDSIKVLSIISKIKKMNMDNNYD